MTDTEREKMIEQAHKIYDNSRNLISELRWQKTYFCRDTNIISNQEKIFNIWIFDECLKQLVERKAGHWVHKATHIKCSQCGTEFNDDIIHMSNDVCYPRFCPFCGTKMEAEK